MSVVSKIYIINKQIDESKIIKKTLSHLAKDAPRNEITIANLVHLHS